MGKNKAEKPRVWIFMVDSRNSEDLRDLDHLDAILWGANPNVRDGDIILMYRTAPYSDIAYIFSASSEPRLTRPEDRADPHYVIELSNKFRLSRPLTLKEIRHNNLLSEWSFARYQQGAMRRKKDIKKEGVWNSLRSLLIARNPSLARVLKELENLRDGSSQLDYQFSHKAGKAAKQEQLPLRVFISYATPDLRRVRLLHRKLSEQTGLDLWFDKVSLVPTDEWHPAIVRAIHSSDAIVICLSSRSVNRDGFAQDEINWAINLFDEQPEGTVSILPVKLDQCDAPPRLMRWQYAELFRKNGFERLIAGLRKRMLALEEAHIR
ncbi:MAG: toll/interleukin-1 receptor domain-containing protein [Rubrivivax sp.]|nr:toll/interleukin-1 receptor domain-containing protein [Pyrinomonadaceae bacterium]